MTLSGPCPPDKEKDVKLGNLPANIFGVIDPLNALPMFIEVTLVGILSNAVPVVVPVVYPPFKVVCKALSDFVSLK